jgi:hypothetical protein
MADDTPTVEQARQAVLRAAYTIAKTDLPDAIDALIAAVRAEMVCPQCEAHGMPSRLIPRS